MTWRPRSRLYPRLCGYVFLVVGVVLVCARPAETTNPANDTSDTTAPPSQVVSVYLTLPAKFKQAPIIKPDYVGLSREWGSDLQEWASSPTVHRLLAYLSRPQETLFSDNATETSDPTTYATTSLNIRVGGNTADRTRWSWSNGSSNNNNKTAIDMTADNIRALFHLARDHVPGTSLTLDLTLFNRWRTVEQARGIVDIVKKQQQNHSKLVLEGFEVGNEPDLYSRNGLRRPNYTVADYMIEYEEVLRRIRPFLRQSSNASALSQPSPPMKRWIQGGTLCLPTSPFARHQGDMMDRWQHDYLQSWSWHQYPLNKCHRQKRGVTISQLLHETASHGAAVKMAQLAQPALQRNLTVRVGEANSVACGGQVNVSDTLAAALWSMDYLFEVINSTIDNTKPNGAMVERVNFHGGGKAAYSWFVFHNDNHTKILEVMPLWYGMMAVRWMTTAYPGARLIPLDCQSSSLVGCGSSSSSSSSTTTTTTTTTTTSSSNNNNNNNKNESFCQLGIIKDGTVCCAASCGHCGDIGCSALPGGPSQCCVTTIQGLDQICQTKDEVGCLLNPDYGIRVKSWGVQYANGHAKIVVINKREATTARVNVRVPASLYDNQGDLVVLTGNINNRTMQEPMMAKRGVSLAGWTWDGSVAGEVNGKFRSTPVYPQPHDELYSDFGDDNVYIFDVHPATATILSLRASAAPAAPPVA